MKQNKKASEGKRRILFPKLYESVDQKSPLFSHQVRSAGPMEDTHSKDHDPKTPMHSNALTFHTDTDHFDRAIPKKRSEEELDEDDLLSLTIPKKESNTQRDIVQLMKEVDEIQDTVDSEHHSSTHIHTVTSLEKTIPMEQHEHDDRIIQTPLHISSDSNESEHAHDDMNKSPTSTASHIEKTQPLSPNVTTLTTILPGRSILKTHSILRNKSSRSPGMTPPLSHSSSSDMSSPETNSAQLPLHNALQSGKIAHEHYLVNKKVQLPLIIPLTTNVDSIEHKHDENKKEEDVELTQQHSLLTDKSEMMLHKSNSESFADKDQTRLSLSFSDLALKDCTDKKLSFHKRGSFQENRTTQQKSFDLVRSDHKEKDTKKNSNDEEFKNKSFIRISSSDVLSTNSMASVIARHMSHEELEQSRKIRFDPRVWVHEVQRPAVEKTWYSHSEIDRFKHEAIMRIRNWTLKRRKRTMPDEIISTGTGRVITRGAGVPVAKNLRALYTNPALRSDAEDDEEDFYSMADRRNQELLKEIRTVLIVDSHDIFLSLLAKDIKSMLPHVKVVTAYTVQEASHRMDTAKAIEGNKCTHGFDLVVIEERLMQRIGRYRSISLPTNVEQSKTEPSSGSSLIQRIAHQVKKLSNTDEADVKSDKSTVNHSNDNGHRVPLVIGISAYLQQDGKKLKDSGADIVWGKPPPRMDESLRNEILRLIMMKRNRSIVSQVFGHITKNEKDDV